MDPIGIAGGANVYGFAGGDPINYRDPFGLCCFNPLAHAQLTPRVIDAAVFENLKAKWPEIEARWNEGVRDVSSLMVVAGGLEGLATGGASAASVAVGTPVYRVSGGGARAVGRFWSTANPSTTANFAARAGLPAANSMTTVSEGFVAEATGVRLTSAAPGARGAGGIAEVQVLDPKAQITVIEIKPYKPPEH